MKGIHNYFSISSYYEKRSDVPFEPGAILLYSSSIEERSVISEEFKLTNSELDFFEVIENDDQTITISISGRAEKFSLRSNQDFQELVRILENLPVYIDITGLTHSTWAWLVKILLYRKIGESFVLYSEPKEYRFSDSPVEGQIFDLSKRISGISPLPGFAKFFQYKSDNFIFMPLLGFEGTRLSYLWEDIQPLKENTVPVFGVPGFRFDYPFFSYQGNKLILLREEIWQNWRYEQANCPVSIYVLGTSLLDEYPDKILRIAPIGTKPHALGAVILKLINPSRVDLIYDHPIRHSKRTSGKQNTICYRLNAFKHLVQI